MLRCDRCEHVTGGGGGGGGGERWGLAEHVERPDPPVFAMTSPSLFHMASPHVMAFCDQEPCVKYPFFTFLLCEINKECKQTRITAIPAPRASNLETFTYLMPYTLPSRSMMNVRGQMGVQRNPQLSHCMQLLAGWSSDMSSAVAVFQYDAHKHSPAP